MAVADIGRYRLCNWTTEINSLASEENDIYSK